MVVATVSYIQRIKIESVRCIGTLAGQGHVQSAPQLAHGAQSLFPKMGICCGLLHETKSQYETGSRTPKAEVTAVLANALGV